MEMKTSKAIIIASVIFLVGIIFYSLSNRFYIDTSTKLVVDRFTGKVTRPIVQTPDSTPDQTNYTASDFEIDNGDFSKVVLAGDSYTVNSAVFKVTCTVKNNDSIPHSLSVKCIFYDKNNKPILTEESSGIKVNSNDIESVTITTFDNINNIASYELKLIQYKYDGVFK